MSTILVLLCVSWCGLSAGSQVFYELKDAELHFENFIQQHGRNYNSDEKQARFEIFKDNLVTINNLNKQSKHAVFGINKFADITLEEFNNMYRGLKNISFDDIDYCNRVTDADILYDDAPESFDWREHNAVTPVKDQYRCGSCYAFSATGNIEGQYAIKHNKLMALSEQQIVDCDKYNKGCVSGVPKDVFITLINNHGIMSEVDYPYVGRKEKCKFDSGKTVVQLIDCITYDLKSQEKVKQILYHVGPISINVKADSIVYYKKGIIDDEICNHGKINHSVLLVGYGEENGVPYWIVKNSWGDSGEHGYFRMHRGENRHSCGMLGTSLASSVVL